MYISPLHVSFLIIIKADCLRFLRCKYTTTTTTTTTCLSLFVLDLSLRLLWDQTENQLYMLGIPGIISKAGVAILFVWRAEKWAKKLGGTKICPKKAWRAKYNLKNIYKKHIIVQV